MKEVVFGAIYLKWNRVYLHILINITFRWQEGRDKGNFGGVNRTDDLRGKSSLAISGGGKLSNIFPHANSFHPLT